MYKHKITKTLTFILTFTIILLLYPNTSAFATSEKPPELNSEGVVVMNAETGQIIYGKNQDKQYYPASTTKILTCLVVLDKVKNLEEKVTVGKNPPFADGTKIGIREGEICTVNELLYGLILESGNDCAEALAEYVSGTKEEFAKLMNEYAKKLGATHSNFKNPSGLPDKEHYTTPTDLALIMKELIKNQKFLDICSTKHLNYNKSNLDDYVRIVNNRNSILDEASKYYYAPSFAAKKGYTIAAHFTNILAAKKNDMTLIVSNLCGDSIDTVYNDIKLILDYCFDNYEKTTAFHRNDEIGSFKIGNTDVPLVATEDINILHLKNTQMPKATIDYTSPTSLDENSYLKKGDILTKGTLVIDGEKITETNLASGIDKVADSDPKSSENENQDDSFSLLKLIKGCLYAILILAVLRIIYVHYRRAKKRKQKRNLKK